MIIPVAFEVSKKEELEDYVLAKTREIVSTPIPAEMRVTVKLFDTDARSGLGFSARLLIDYDAEPYHDLMTMFKFGGEVVGNRDDMTEYLRALRDAINEELGE